MKIVLTSDLHFKLGHYVDIYLNDYEGIYYPTHNLWLATEICKKENANYLFILGDVFDRSSNSHFLIDVMGRFFESLSKICEIFILLGNHDIEIKYKNIKDYYSTLRAYKNIVNVIENVYVDHNEKFVLIPFNVYDVIIDGYSDEWKDYLLFTHIGINGFQYKRGTYSSREPINIDMLRNYSMVISGHYHLHSFEKNVYYLGSPWNVRVDELGDDKWIHVLDTNTLSIKKYKSIYSQLIEIPVENIESLNLSTFDKIFSENRHAKIKLILKDTRLINSIDSLIKEFGTSRIFYSVVEDSIFKTSFNTETKLQQSEVKEVNLDINYLLQDYITENEKQYVDSTIEKSNEFIETFEKNKLNSF